MTEEKVMEEKTGEKGEFWDNNRSVRGGNVDYGRYPANYADSLISWAEPRQAFVCEGVLHTPY